MSNFELVVSLKADGNVPFSKYKSKKTGLTVCIAQVAGPIVTGYLCLATEAHDDDGLPHTLEHLVFMGSEEFPYKGVLDMLANRCLASGTNAWTDTDHTCYTMTTAGSDGFLNLLPIYLDHILFPMLTDAAFITEVHHINGNGEDAGVVYCEMQARENMGESLCHLQTLRALYPGHCGYKSETGGIMKNLRESTTNEKIHAYHRQFYRPENLCIIITGQCAPEQVFKALQPIEDKILSKGPSGEFARPWQTPVPPLPESVYQKVPYPCDDDLYGLLYIAWRGPKSLQFRDLMAMFTLFDYLTHSSVSPLNQAFVETDDPYCSKIGFSVNENFVSCIYLTFSNVPKDKLDLIKDKLVDLLRAMTTGEVPFDMDRMQSVIRRRRLTILSQMECSPHDSIALNIIGDFLYGNSVEDLCSRIQHVPIMEGLAKEGPTYWIGLIQTYLVDGPMVATVGVSDPDLMEKLAQEDKERVEEQRKILGKDGLEDKQKALTAAMAANEIEPPPELVTSVPVPSSTSIHFHTIQRTCNYRNNLPSSHPGTSLIQNLPVRFQLDSVSSNFVEIYAMMDTSSLSLQQRLHLPIFLRLLRESPILRGEELVPYERVVAELSADLVHHDASLGVVTSSQFSCGSFGQLVTLYIKVDLERYERGVQWVRELLHQTHFSAKRAAIMANKIIADVSEHRREGLPVTSTLLKSLVFSPRSNNWVSTMFRQLAFLRRLSAKLTDSPQEVIKMLSDIRDIITSPENMTIHMCCNVEALPNLRQPWLELFSPDSPEQALKEVKLDWDSALRNSPDSPLPRGVIVGVGSVESSYLIQNAPCITDYKDPQLAALMVLLQYLTQLEGPLWRQLRGQGLAYNFSMTLDVSKGAIYLVLAQCTHLAAAYQEARTIVAAHLDGTAPWYSELLASARSSLAFELVEKEKSISDICLQSLLAYYRGVDMDYTKNFLKLISEVEVSAMLEVGHKYLQPLFDPSVSRCAICCNPSKVDEVVAMFAGMDRQLTLVSNLEESFAADLLLDQAS